MNLRHVRGPHNRIARSHNRAACPMAVLSAIACCLSAASGQWFEGYIALPDSLKAGGRPVVALYDPANARTYVGGDESDRLIVFDSAGVDPVGSIRVGPAVRAMCVDSLTNSVYCANYSFDSITIVNAWSGTPIRRLWSGGDRPGSLCFNPRYNKVYCGNFDDWIQVVDAASRQPLSRVRTPAWPGLMDCDPTTGRVFIGCTYCDTVAILDGASDTIVARIPLKYGSDVTGVLFDPLDGLVYASNDDYRVYIIDPAQRTVIDSVSVDGIPRNIALNSAHNKLYVPCNSSNRNLTVIDCATRKVVAQIPVSSAPLAACYGKTTDKAYCSTYGDSVVVVDGVTNGVIARDAVGHRPNYLCYSPAGNRVFSANYDGRSVTIIDGVSNGVIATTSICGTAKPASLCWDSTDRRTYVASTESPGAVWVIDGVTDAVCDSVRVGIEPSDVCYNSQRNKVYCANRGSGTVSAIDCHTNTVVATVHTGSQPSVLHYDRLRDKVYCANRSSNTVSVISCSSDSVIKSISVGSTPATLCYNPITDRLYCANYTYDGSISVVDCGHDSVVKTIATHYPSAMICDTVLNLLYSVSYNGLQFVDCELDSIVATMGLGILRGEQDVLAMSDPANHQLLVGSYRASGGRGNYYGYTVVNTQTRSVVHVQDLGWDLYDHLTQVYHSPGGHSYCATDNKIWLLSNGAVIDIGAATDGFASNPYWNRVYLPCPQSSCIAVIGESHVPAVYEYPEVESATPHLVGTITRGILPLLEAASRKPRAASLLDISGRKVMDLHPGANDVRALAPGVYFVREAQAQAQAQAIRKVVITR